MKKSIVKWEGIEMIVDVTGTILMPGNRGKDCLGNGTFAEVECCCDECDYKLCCSEYHSPSESIDCEEYECPRKQ